MKIIHQGQKPSERIYQGTCTICWTVIEFTQGEATASHDQRDPGWHHPCPTCGNTIFGTSQTNQCTYNTIYDR